MKSIFLFIILAVSVNSAFAGRIGGISGGGGGTIIQDPVGRYHIESLLSAARLPVYMYFNSKIAAFGLQKIGQPTGEPISQIIENVKIHVESSGPCFDAYGNEMDGSIHSPVPGTICISSKNLGEKLDADNAFSQTMSLVAHEYSHLIGANEDEADEIQRSALYEFNTYADYRSGTSLISDFTDARIEFMGRLPKVAGSEDPRSAPYLQKIRSFVTYGGMVFSIFDHFNNTFYAYERLMTPAHRTKVWVLLAKWEVVRRGIKLFMWGPDWGTHQQEEYDNGFNGHKEVSVSDFEQAQRFPLYVKNLPQSEVTVLKIESHQDIASSLDDLAAEWSALFSEIRESNSAVAF